MNDDLISRQELLKSIERISVKGDVLDDDWIYRFIQEFPSAQPEVLARGEGELSAQSEPCEDAVSRKAVEEMLKNGFPARGMWEIEGDVVKQTVCETLADALMDLERLPSTQSEIIYCKDCKKHNKVHGHYYDGTWVGIMECCPLAEIRGAAQGHEFDYQFCAYAEKRGEKDG